MRISSLILDNVRAIEHLELKALPETGVIVIHGDNEQGKSTIMDALNAVLKFRHNSAKREVKAIAPAHRDEAPEVTASLTVGPVELTIHKRWLKRKSAELTIHAPQRANYTGAEAEDKLDEILAEHLDDTLLETLFLRQDDLGSGIKAAGIPSLQQALVAGQEEAAGPEGVIDASEDDGLMAAVEREYQRFFTATGKENKALTNTRRDRERAAEELTAAKKKSQELQSYVDQVDRHEQSLRRDEADLPEARAQVEAAEAAVTTARQAEVQAEAASTQVEHATQALTSAQREVTERAEIKEQSAELAAAQKALQAQLTEATAKAEAEKAKVAGLTQAVKDAKTARTEAAERVKRARRAVKLIDDITTRDQLIEIIERLDALDDNLSGVRAQLAGRRICDDDVRAVEGAVQDLQLARRFRELAVPYLELTADPAAQVTVDGEPRAVGEEPLRVDATEGTELIIGDVTARYRAGNSGDASADEAVDQAEAHLNDLLGELECETLDEVRSRRDDETATVATLRRLEEEKAALLAGRSADDVRAQATNLTAALDGVDVPDLRPEEAAAEVEAAEAAREKADTKVDEAEAALTPWQQGLAERELICVTANHDNAVEQATDVAAKLAALEEKSPEEALEEAVASARAELERAAEAEQAAAAAVAEADPKGKQDAFEAATARVDSIQRRITQAGMELARLDGYIAQAAGAAERLEKAQARDEAMRRQLGNLERQAVAAQRLREVLRRHRDEARARYAQPFVDELTKLSRTVFGPEVAFELTEDLTVRDRTVGGATVPLSALSGGAKEQLAILTRFAIASLVAGKNSDERVSVPVIVDDALGSTDPDRLQRMGQLFNQMGKNSQVIVLTCVPQRYDWVQPRTEYSMTQLKSAG